MKRVEAAESGTGGPIQLPSGHATLKQWRRIALERQLPQPRFPGGLGVPSLVIVLCLTIVGATAVTYFLRPPPRVVPHAVVASQKELVSDIAHRVEVGAQRDSDDVRTVAAEYGSDAKHNAAALVASTAAAQSGYRSVAIWDPATGKTVAAAGEPLPASVLRTAKDTAIGYVAADLHGRLVHVVRLSDGRVLGVSEAVAIRNLTLNPAASQTVMFVLNADTLVYSQGKQVLATDPVKSAVTLAVAAHATHTSVGTSVTIDGHRRVPVVSASPVDGTQYSVVSIIYVQRSGVDASDTAAALGVVLVVLALVGFAWTRLAFVRPLTRLLGDAKAVACGELGGASRASRLREAQRIGAALGDLSPLKSPPHRRTQRWRVGAAAVVTITSLATAVWSVALFAVVRDASTIPTQIVADYQNHADGAANALRDTLDTGLSRLQELAADHTSSDRDGRAVARLLARFVKDNSRFRSAYQLDRDGNVTAEAGASPLRRGAVSGRTAGVVLDGQYATVPLVLAHVPYGSGQLVAEFDVISLRSVLHRVHGDVHVVDRKMRSMLDTGGFIAFHTVRDSTVQTAARAALSTDGSVQAPESSRRVLAASVVGADPGVTAAAGAGAPGTVAASPAAALGWVVVVTRDVSDLGLPTTQSLHVAWLLMVLAITVTVLGWTWQYVVFVRPLQTLATTAERVTNGDHRTPIAPERFDEIGALAICLEVCRQAASDGGDRLAGAVRLRGEGDDYTVVMSKIKA
jgi:hypothetical protein